LPSTTSGLDIDLAVDDHYVWYITVGAE
jgi:hypothetical protein